MADGIHEIKIAPMNGHWEVHINGEFFCSADSYNEAVQELEEAYG